MYFGGTIMTFALPIGAFIVISVALFYLFRCRHSGPRLKYLAHRAVHLGRHQGAGPGPGPGGRGPGGSPAAAAGGRRRTGVATDVAETTDGPGDRRQKARRRRSDLLADRARGARLAVRPARPAGPARTPGRWPARSSR